LLPALLILLAGPGAIRAQPTPLEFQLSFSPEVSRQPFTGRVYVVLSKDPIKEPRSGPNWFSPEPFFARDVKDWQPNQPITLGQEMLGHPHTLTKLPAGTYHIQAIMDFDRGHISFATAEGNGHSQPIKQELKPPSSGTVKLRIDQVYKAKAFQQTDRVKLVDIPSPLLSAFHGQPIRLRAGVVLPASFDAKSQRKYPVIYEVPGFSGTHFSAFRAAERKATDVAGIDFLYVVLDPSCRLGHHVFADSENNGPCGQALISELVPHIEKEYRGLGSPAGRFVTGHSSGGWSSLWLQVRYPDFFGGVWSTAPDPVDFRDFQRIDLTRPEANLFVDDKGQSRPIARRGQKSVLTFKEFSDMEVVMGHGGQLASFEAVFSPRGPDGKPRQLWHRTSGDIDPEVARSWEKYDIRKALEKEWPTLGPRLAGKLHIYMGEEDTFYLEGATRLLKETLKGLGSDAIVELFPKRNHGTLMDTGLRKRIAQEMADRYRRLQARAE
jgi:hypothetical protein